MQQRPPRGITLGLTGRGSSIVGNHANSNSRAPVELRFCANRLQFLPFNVGIATICPNLKSTTYKLRLVKFYRLRPVTIEQQSLQASKPKKLQNETSLETIIKLFIRDVYTGHIHPVCAKSEVEPGFCANNPAFSRFYFCHDYLTPTL